MSLGRLVSTKLLLKSTTRNAARFRPIVGSFTAYHTRSLRPLQSVTVGLGSTRNLSFWRSTPPASSSAPPPSSTTQEVLEVISDNVPEPETIAATTPVPESTSASDFVTSLDIPSAVTAPPLNYGDLAALGFSGWTPAGIAQWSMELIQVSSGMPWFWTIVTVTVLSRLVVLPFNLNSIRASARLAPHQPRLMALRNELQATGGLTNDPIAVQRISLQQKKIYEDAGVSIAAPLLTPLVQLPISLGLFFGIKRLCELPLEQLKVGGVGWITDLTAADPTYMLPLAMAVMINVQLSIGARDITQDTAQTMHLFNVFKAVAFLSVPFMTHLPAGVMVYLFTGVAAMAAQSLILRVPSVRKTLNIPIIPDNMRVKPPTFLDTAKVGIDWFKTRGAQAEAQTRARQGKKF